MEQVRAKAPLSYWVVTVLGLLWNAYGGIDYTMTRIGNAAWLSQQGDPQAILAWIDGFPLWAQIAWGLGVWGSVAGSLLMVVRSRHAASAFVVSLIGAIASFGYQIGHTPAGMGPVAIGMIALLVLLVIAFLWQFCQRELVKGILR